jgi:phosphoenolpyruvate---glycerone phosphotransferase subunit DhaK
MQGKVAIISGGGSGHEPMHNGFVGIGMLDAACPGEIFTSPTPDQMLEAAKAVHGGAGVLFLVNNYAGDVMNFEMAAELVRSERIHVTTVLIDDDVAVRNSLYTQGRRGVGSSIIAEKILGAAAEKGYSLQQLTVLGRRITQSGRSMGIALTSCIVPARGKPTFALGESEAEFGIGVHGEPGRERITMESADFVTQRLFFSILEDKEYNRELREWNEMQSAWVDVEFKSAPLKSGDKVLAFVNNMGGTPISELYIVYRKLAELCAQKGLIIVRNLVGTYMTSLEMQGCSITLFRMDDEMVHLWDAPVNTPAINWGI